MIDQRNTRRFAGTTGRTRLACNDRCCSRVQCCIPTLAYDAPLLFDNGGLSIGKLILRVRGRRRREILHGDYNSICHRIRFGLASVCTECDANRIEKRAGNRADAGRASVIIIAACLLEIKRAAERRCSSQRSSAPIRRIDPSTSTSITRLIFTGN